MVLNIGATLIGSQKHKNLSALAAVEKSLHGLESGENRALLMTHIANALFGESSENVF